MDFKDPESGFSLIEMSIVLLIIGLIIGGILKGQDLLESAKLKATMSQINEFRIAANIFYDKYDALPGDFEHAQQAIHISLKNGNGNGVVEGTGLTLQGEGHESLSFWAHLAAAGLISEPGVIPSSGVARFGQGAPASKMGGGFTVRHNPASDLEGHWFVLGKENGVRGDAALLTAEQAHAMDRKMDNGDPLSGRVQARDGQDQAPGSCVQQGRYNMQNKKPACVLYVQF